LPTITALGAILVASLLKVAWMSAILFVVGMGHGVGMVSSVVPGSVRRRVGVRRDVFLGIGMGGRRMKKLKLGKVRLAKVRLRKLVNLETRKTYDNGEFMAYVPYLAHMLYGVIILI
jgi:hypothetical protein